MLYDTESKEKLYVIIGATVGNGRKNPNSRIVDSNGFDGF